MCYYLLLKSSYFQDLYEYNWYNIDTPNIKYHIYREVFSWNVQGQILLGVTSRCNLCHKIIILIKEKRWCWWKIPFKIHDDSYGPAIKKLAFYLPHVTILGKNHCGKNTWIFSKKAHVHVCEDPLWLCGSSLFSFLQSNPTGILLQQ